MSFCNQCGSELPEGARFCANCGAPTGAASAAPTGAAPTPPPPHRPTTFSQPAPADPAVQSSGGGLGWILPALVIVAVIAIAYLMFVPKRGATPAETNQQAAAGDGEAARPVGTSDAPADRPASGRAVDEASDAAMVAGANARNASSSVSAAVLDSAFNSDPDGAAVRYAGPIRVSGIIASMVQPGATPSLSMEGRTRFNYMIVNFPAGYRERLAPLSKGQFISVACDEVRELGGTTILSGCLLG